MIRLGRDYIKGGDNPTLVLEWIGFENDNWLLDDVYGFIKAQRAHHDCSLWLSLGSVVEHRVEGFSGSGSYL